jgi:hypothetical protein
MRLRYVFVVVDVGTRRPRLVPHAVVAHERAGGRVGAVGREFRWTFSA